MIEFTAPSGAKVVINEADWPDAKRLKKAIQRELADTKISLDLKSDLTMLIPAFLKVDASDAVDAAIAPCLIRCLRNGEKITDTTFNDPAARKDYYHIVTKCVEVNVRPLAESLFLALKEFMAEMMKNESPPPSI